MRSKAVPTWRRRRLTLTLLAGASLPPVESVDGDTYGRTIRWAARPGLLKISPGGGGHLLRAHLPSWEGLIHVVDRGRAAVGINTDHAAMAAMFRADAVLGPMVT